MTQRIYAEDPLSPAIASEIAKASEERSSSVDLATASMERIGSVEEARRALKWGPKFVPQIHKKAPRANHLATLRELRRLADSIQSLSAPENRVADEAAPFIVQLNDVLEELFDRDDAGDSFKTIIALLQAQLGGATWTSAHSRLVGDVARFLFSQSLIDETAVQEVVRMIDEAGLDVFRGTLLGANEDPPGKESEPCRP